MIETDGIHYNELRTAEVQTVSWKMNDAIYDWHTRPNNIEIGPEAIWEWHPVIKHELEAFRYVCENKQPKVFIDIGAHCGIFSSVYCALIENHECHSIEPIKDHMDRLSDTSKLNSWNLTTHPIALNNYVGNTYYHNTHMAMFVDNEDYTVSDEIVNNNIENSKIHEVQINTLDNFVNQYNLKPDLIKIDVEGYEIPILEQSYETLSNNNVDLFIETHRDECLNLGWNIEQICDYLKPDQYRFYTYDLNYEIIDLKDYVLNYDSNMRFVALHKNNLIEK